MDEKKDNDVGKRRSGTVAEIPHRGHRDASRGCFRIAVNAGADAGSIAPAQRDTAQSTLYPVAIDSIRRFTCRSLYSSTAYAIIAPPNAAAAI